MTASAFIFPGQGSQSAGMAAGLLGDHPETARLFEEASEATGWDVERLCREGDEAELAATDKAQPAILTVSVAMLHVLRERTAKPVVVAGHSLGEYSALVAAGLLSFPAAVSLVAARSRLMAAAAEPGEGGMAAVIGLDEAAVEAALAGLADAVAGPFIANLNCPGQIVISGSPGKLAEAETALKEAGARRILGLKVAGAFHSPFMAGAAAEFAAYLDDVEFRTPAIPLVSNFTGSASLDAGEIKEALRRQMTGPVRWQDSVNAMRAAGAERFIEVGPGRVLLGLAKRCGVEAGNLSHFEDIVKAD